MRINPSGRGFQRDRFKIRPNYFAAFPLHLLGDSCFQLKLKFCTETCVAPSGEESDIKSSYNAKQSVLAMTRRDVKQNGAQAGKSPYIALAIAVFAVSFAAVLIRLSEAPPMAIATYRMTITTLILVPPALLSGAYSEMVRASRRESAIVLLAGAALAVHFASWISSLSLTSVTSSVVIVNSSPVFVAVVGRYLLREGVTPKMALGIAAALLGCSVIASADLGLGGVNLQGDIYALVGALAAAVYVLGGRMIRRTTGLLAYVLPVYAICSLILGGAAMLLKTPLHPYQEREYWIFMALAIVPTIFGHTLYNWALRFVPASVVAVSLLGEPVGAAVLAGVVLREYPTPLTVFGAVLTLTGIYVTARK